MKLLKAIHDEVMPKYQKLADKKAKIKAEVDTLLAEMKKAEENYDVDTIEKIETKLKARKKVFDRLNADIEEYRNKINKNGELQRRIEEATATISKKVNDEAQEKFAELRKLREETDRQIAQLKSEIKDLSMEARDEVEQILEKMRPVLPTKSASRIVERTPGRIMVYDKKLLGK